MRLLGITDLHGRRDALARIVAHAGPADVICLGGDITHFGSPIDVDWIVDSAQTTGAKVFAVAGNCDNAGVDRRLAELGVSLSGRGTVHQGVGFHGLSGIPPWKGGMYQFPEEELAATLEAGFAQLDSAPSHVVLVHPPPYKSSLDRTTFGCDAGSRAVAEFIDGRQPQLVLCGHIHEGRGVVELGSTTVVNCGFAGRGYYAVAESGEHWTVDLRQA